MAQKLVIVTGFAELDAKLKSLPPKLQRKFVRGGLRKGANRVVRDAKKIIRNEAYDTGAYFRALKVRSLKRSRKRVGVSVHGPREKLFAAYAAKHEGKPPHPAKGESDPFYYPAAIEFGTDTRPPVRPMRRALYDNANELRALFVADVRQFIAENKVTTRLPKAVKASKL
jgi:HK97 gp10 family phage protein